MQWQRDVHLSSLGSRAVKSGREKDASLDQDFVGLLRSGSTIFKEASCQRIWAAVTYAYTLMRLVSRYVKSARLSCAGGKMVVTYNGLKAANALDITAKEILAVLYARNVWLDYYKQMRTAKFQRLSKSTICTPHYVFWKIILRRQLHDIRKPLVGEDAMQMGAKRKRHSDENFLGTSASVPPSDRMWSALLRCLERMITLTTDKSVVSELVLLFVALATRTRSEVLLQSAMEMRAWKDAAFLKEPLEAKAEVLASHLHALHGASWKKKLKVKDYSISTCTLASSGKKWIFAGLTSASVATLMEPTSSLSTQRIGNWARTLPHVGPFVAQHWNLNMYQLAVDTGAEIIKPIEFSPLQANAISLRNTAKSCARFVDTRSNQIPGAASLGDEASDDEASEDELGADDDEDDEDSQIDSENNEAGEGLEEEFFEWLNPLGICFSRVPRSELPQHYNTLQKELEQYRALNGVWRFEFGLTADVRLRLSGDELRALDLDNLLCNSCMLEKVLQELMLHPQSFFPTC